MSSTMRGSVQVSAANLEWVPRKFKWAESVVRGVYRAGMQKVELHLLSGHRRRQVWASGNPASWQYAEVTTGQLEDGQWYAARVGQQWSGAWKARDKAEALQAVEAWMRRRGGEWREAPASFDASGRPNDGRAWWRSGAQWLPGVRPDDAVNDDA